MQVRVRYFASLREALGSGEVVDAPQDCTVGALRDLLVARGGVHAQALARSRAVRAAVDQTMADDAAGLRDGVEVAFFPPVTGG
ncbi:MAG TPA: molybdopterin converting factor subunit 1 [Burkholderiaceae bacterium]|nr:molybdopterin converting factor subunit 1 [Burkholderiaceae bacterium]